MQLSFFQVTLLVADYDDAINFYVNKLGFLLLEDTKLSDTKRWVRVAPWGNNTAALLLAKAGNENQLNFIGNQT
ncbi:MAG TPA: VOC family protein, partial [Bacteroidia bacterium]|nr:VOC family protein [Bacteroidia bacterium]